MVPFDEISYRKFMDTTVADWVANQVESGTIKSYDGAKIAWYKAIPENPKAAVVFVHGFCEFFGKYHEMCYNFYDNGYATYFIEQRGHGHSERSVPELDRVDVLDFMSYVKDLKSFLDQIVVPDSKVIYGEGIEKKPILFAHSMGGAVGTLFLEEYPEYFRAAILNSPMQKMKFGDFKTWQVKLLITISKVLGWKNKLMPGQGVWDGKPDFANSACLSEARYLYQFNQREKDEMCRSSGGTYNWGRTAFKWTEFERRPENCAKVKIPVLLCEAGRDDFVDNTGHAEFAKYSANTTIVYFQKSKHEIFNGTEEILKEYYPTLFDFLTAQG